MRIEKHKSLFLVFFLFSIYIGTIIWDFIIIDYKNPNIIGKYSKNQYNAINEIIRYFVFLSLPTFTFIIYKFYTNKHFIFEISNFFNDRNDFFFQKNVNLDIFYFILILTQILSFFSIEFSTLPIDGYHEGQRTSSAYQNFLNNSLWSKSYVTVGIFYETLSSSIFWKIFDNTSIGIARYADILYIFIFKIILISLFYFISKITKLDSYKQVIFLLINSFIIINLNDYDTGNVDLISFREIPILILTFLFLFVIINQRQFVILFFISLLSPTSMIWGIDRGLVCNILILIIFIFLIISKRYKESFFILFFLIFSWILTYLVLGEEFKYFLNNTLLIFKEMNYIHGIIHPTPFSDQPNSSRATKTLLLILICIIISINSLFKKKYSKEFIKILIFFTIISVGSYLYSLGRSDGPHIKNSFGYPLITFSIFLSYLILKKIKNISRFNYYLCSSIIFIFLIISSNINIKNILSYNERIKDYFNLDDEAFLSSKEKKLIKFLEPKVKNFDCIQLYSNDVILYYLLKKKSCTKFYLVWSASSSYNQNRLIKELSNTKIIIAGGSKNNWDLPLQEKLYLLDTFIKKKYQKTDSFYDWDIYISK